MLQRHQGEGACAQNAHALQLVERILLLVALDPSSHRVEAGDVCDLHQGPPPPRERGRALRGLGRRRLAGLQGLCLVATAHCLAHGFDCMPVEHQDRCMLGGHRDRVLVDSVASQHLLAEAGALGESGHLIFAARHHTLTIEDNVQRHAHGALDDHLLAGTVVELLQRVCQLSACACGWHAVAELRHCTEQPQVFVDASCRHLLEDIPPAAELQDPQGGLSCRGNGGLARAVVEQCQLAKGVPGANLDRGLPVSVPQGVLWVRIQQHLQDPIVHDVKLVTLIALPDDQGVGLNLHQCHAVGDLLHLRI
mmetsp:Transcript_49461/g.143443  ORF Transcript_49461/g.143443 Transcript_49461/m.143443 type:complete len:308 (-) Transcript_49461:1140-2063(-)